MRLRARLAVAVAATAALLVTGWVVVSAHQRDARLDDALREFATATLGAGGRERCEADPGRFVVHVPGPGAIPGRMGRGPFRRLDDLPPRGPRPRPDDVGPERVAPPRTGLVPGPDSPPRPDDARTDGPRPPGPQGPGPMGPGPGRPREEDGTWLWAYDAMLVSANAAAPPLPAPLRDALAADARTAAADWSLGDRAGRQVAVRTAWPDGPCAVVLVRRMRPTDAGDLSTLWVGGLTLALGVLGAVWLAAGSVVRRLRRLEQHVGRTDPRPGPRRPSSPATTRSRRSPARSTARARRSARTSPPSRRGSARCATSSATRPTTSARR